MTVAEMIEQLRAMDQSAEVFVHGYEDGLNPAGPPRATAVSLWPEDSRASYYGTHMDNDSPGIGGLSPMTGAPAAAVVIEGVDPPHGHGNV